MLSDLTALHAYLSVPTSETAQDSTFLGALLAADATAKHYCKRLFETQIVQEFPLLRGGGEALVLEQTPVLSYRQNGTIANGSPVITGLSDTSRFFVGMPVVQAVGPQYTSTTQPFPNGVTIQSVDSAAQVTLTGNATTSLSGVPFVFGLAVWLDLQGSYGDGVGTDPSGPFGPLTLLNAGLDYSIQRDQPDGSSKSGKLIRGSSLVGALGMGGNWSPYGSAWGGFAGRGTLTTPLPPLWPRYPPGCVKVVYAAGLGTWLAPPPAPTLATATTGGTLPAATYSVLVTYTNAYGETLGSYTSTITTTGTTSTLTITSPPATSLTVGNATGWNGYVNGVLQNATPTAIGTNLTLTSVATTGAGVPNANTATRLPAELTQAVNAVAAWMLRNADSGLQQYQSESFQGYSASLAPAVDALKSGSELGSVRDMLSRFRKVVI